MKHALCTMLAVLSLSGAYAQKNSVLLFGNSGGYREKSTDPTNDMTRSLFLINTGVGYQFSDHVTLGLQGGFKRTKTEEATFTTPVQSGTNSGSEFGVGVFGRYTWYLGDRLFIYLQGDAGYNHYSQSGTTTSGPEPADSKSSSFGADLMPAVGFFIKKGWAANLNIGTVGYRYLMNGDARTNTIQYNIGQAVVVGFSKNFTRKAKPQVQTGQ